MRFKYTVVKQTEKRDYRWGVVENGDIVILCQNETNANTLAELLTRIEDIDHREVVRLEDRRIDIIYQPRTLASKVALEIVKDLEKKSYDCEDIEAIAVWVKYLSTQL